MGFLTPSCASVIGSHLLAEKAEYPDSAALRELVRRQTNMAETALSLATLGEEERIWAAAEDPGARSSSKPGTPSKVTRGSTGDIVEMLGHSSGGDSGVLGVVKYDARGVRRENHSSAVARMREEPFQDFPVRNNRSLV